MKQLIAIHSADATKNNYPNYALMKISSYHKQQKDKVVWFIPLLSNTYDKTYISKVFSWSKNDCEYLSKNSCYGGTGFYDKISEKLPDYIDDCFPDYSLYPNFTYSMGFVTRGCVNNCKFCIVPQKEGYITPYRTAKELLRNGSKELVLMDNNIIASNFGIEQIEWIVNNEVATDFNQGLDARILSKNNDLCKLLIKVKSINTGIRLACDHSAIVDDLLSVIIKMTKYNNGKKTYFFVYWLIQDVKEAHQRLKLLFNGLKFISNAYVNIHPQAVRSLIDGTYKEECRKYEIWLRALFFQWRGNFFTKLNDVPDYNSELVGVEG